MEMMEEGTSYGRKYNNTSTSLSFHMELLRELFDQLSLTN